MRKGSTKKQAREVLAAVAASGFRHRLNQLGPTRRVITANNQTDIDLTPFMRLRGIEAVLPTILQFPEPFQGFPP